MVIKLWDLLYSLYHYPIITVKLFLNLYFCFILIITLRIKLLFILFSSYTKFCKLTEFVFSAILISFSIYALLLDLFGR